MPRNANTDQTGDLGIAEIVAPIWSGQVVVVGSLVNRAGAYEDVQRRSSKHR